MGFIQASCRSFRVLVLHEESTENQDYLLLGFM